MFIYIMYDDKTTLLHAWGAGATIKGAGIVEFTVINPLTQNAVHARLDDRAGAGAAPDQSLQGYGSP